jgi:hypothetical protein
MEPSMRPSAARRWSILLIHKNFTNANGEESPFKSGHETSEGAPAPCLGGSEPYIASRLRALEAFFTKPTKYPTGHKFDGSFNLAIHCSAYLPILGERCAAAEMGNLICRRVGGPSLSCAGMRPQHGRAMRPAR